jgi:hypothetical protein
MTLTTRGKRLVFALYSLLIIILVYRIMTIDNECITQDLATYVASDYHYGTPEEKERAIETIYQWRGGIKLNDDNTHEIIFDCVQANKN